VSSITSRVDHFSTSRIESGRRFCGAVLPQIMTTFQTDIMGPSPVQLRSGSDAAVSLSCCSFNAEGLSRSTRRDRSNKRKPFNPRQVSGHLILKQQVFFQSAPVTFITRHSSPKLVPRVITSFCTGVCSSHKSSRSGASDPRGRGGDPLAGKAPGPGAGRRGPLLLSPPGAHIHS